MKTNATFLPRLAAVLMILTASARAELKLPDLFGDHMVLQSGKARVWGTATAGEQITVSVAGRSARTTADPQGRWLATLTELPPGGPHELTVQGSTTLTCRDVLIGDVWLLGGQSNMEWPLADSADGAAAVAAADAPQIRSFIVQRRIAQEPAVEPQGRWVVCSPATAAKLSAVGYYFAREIQKHRPGAVGLIGAYWGATSATAWTPESALREARGLPDYFAQWHAHTASYPRQKEAHDKALAAWKEAVRTAEAAGLPKPPKPRGPLLPDGPNAPSVLFNGMVAPVAPFSLSGVQWYQGEADVERHAEYRILFPALITAWRAAFQAPELPFFFVQLAGFLPANPQPTDTPLARQREAQTAALALPATGMVTAIDLGEENDIHPRDKKSVGERLAHLVLRRLYSLPTPESGPVIRSADFKDGRAVIEFAHASGLQDVDGGTLDGFALAGDDRVFHWAEAKIEGERVILSSPAVPAPKAARHAWANFPMVDLVNADLLPALPFRTDDWPLEPPPTP